MNIIRETWNEFSQDDCGTLAAALAYYTVFSLPAALLIIVKVAGTMFGEAAVQGQLQAHLASSMGPQVADEIGTMIAHAAKSTSGGTVVMILGIIGLGWSASNVTNQLQTALNRVWSLRPKDEGIGAIVGKRLLSFLLIVGIGLLVLIGLAASAAATGVSHSLALPPPLIEAVEAAISFVIFMFLFGTVYKVLPDAFISWADVRLGAILTAVLFVIGKFLIGLYIGHTSAASGYGVAGSLALLLLWTYYSSLIFLLGAEFTQVWGRRQGMRIEPDSHAVRISEEEQRPRTAA
jgi:membrane protein